MTRTIKTALATLALAVGLVYLLFLHYTEVGWIGIERNVVSGELRADTPGWNMTSPWTFVAKIDTRPVRVCVIAVSRGFNCRLVQFQPAAYKSLVETEGFRYYWWDNRISFNFGYAEEYRGIRDLMRGYGYSVKQYPFIKVIREFQEGE